MNVGDIDSGRVVLYVGLYCTSIVFVFAITLVIRILYYNLSRAEIPTKYRFLEKLFFVRGIVVFSGGIGTLALLLSFNPYVSSALAVCAGAVYAKPLLGLRYTLVFLGCYLTLWFFIPDLTVFDKVMYGIAPCILMAMVDLDKMRDLEKESLVRMLTRQ